jgi:hypothetical protein
MGSMNSPNRAGGNATAQTKGKKSKYAKKIARKLGRGSVDPRWMWWLERPQAGAVADHTPSDGGPA